MTRQMDALRKQLGEERTKKLALQQWKNSKQALLAQAEAQERLLTSLNGRPVQDVLVALDAATSQIAQLQKQHAKQIRAQELHETKLKNEARQLRLQLDEEMRIKQQAFERVEKLRAFVEAQVLDWLMDCQTLNTLRPSHSYITFCCRPADHRG